MSERTRAFAIDDARASGAVELTIDSHSDDGFSWSEATIVEIDHPPHEAAFDSKKFYKIPLTAARSVDQTYQTSDGEEMVMRKPAAELEKATWSLDNAPITLGHPASKICDSIDLVHGFVRHPSWDSTRQAIESYGYIPVTDGRAQRFIESNDGVSIGFWYEATEADDDPSVDAYQRDLLVDHLAIVDEGRCSREDGCGLAADAQAMRGFTAAADDACSDGPCSCGLHVGVDTDVTDIDLTPPEAVQSAAQDALDARDDDDVTVNGMTDTGWSRAEQLASGDALDSGDIVSGTDAMAAWWSRHASHTISGSGDSMSLKGADKDNPWSDNSYTAGKGWGGVAGYKWAIRKGNEIKRARGKEPDYAVDVTATRTQNEDTIMADSVSVDDWVKWDAAGGTAYGKVDEVVREGCTSRGKGDMEVCAEEDDNVAVIENYDDETGESKEQMVRHKVSELRMWDGPSNDAQHENDVMDGSMPISYDGTREGDLDESEIPNEGYEDHYVFAEDTKTASSFPLVDADGMLRRENVIAAASFSDDAPDEEMLMNVLRDVNDEFDDPPLTKETLMDVAPTIDRARFTATDTNMTDTDSGAPHIDVSDLTVDAIAKQHDEVAQLTEKADELEAQLDSAQEEIDSLEEELETYRADEKRGMVDEILELTETFEEDELMVMAVDQLEDRLQIAKDAATHVSTPERDPAVEADGGDGSTSVETDSGSEWVAGEVYDLSETA